MTPEWVWWLLAGCLVVIYIASIAIAYWIGRFREADRCYETIEVLEERIIALEHKTDG